MPASHSLMRTALILGLLSCVGPFAIDMYLPAMPAIAADLGASVAGMQMTITAYFVAYGLAQMVYGPWADRAGRKPPLYAGLAVFLIGSVLCTLATTAGGLIAGRVIQGLGGAVLMVVPRAIIRDRHRGPEATRLMAAVMLVISVSPMLAPLAGAGLLAVADWRAIFGALVVAGLVSLAVLHLGQAETLAPADRRPVDLRAMGAAVRRLILDRGFMALTLLGGFGMASFFVFISSAPFVYQDAFGLSPTGFSAAFAVNAVGFFSASQAAGPLGARFGSARVMALASLGFALATVALFLTGLAGLVTLWVCIGGLFLANACLGLVIPTAMVLALEEHGDIAGMASSLGGTLQMLAGGLMIAAAGPFFDGTVLPMLGAIAVCGVLALALGRLVPAGLGPQAASRETSARAAS